METTDLNAYLTQTVGQQLLGHYDRRDAVRHATPLVPFSFADLRAWFGMGSALDRKAA